MAREHLNMMTIMGGTALTLTALSMQKEKPQISRTIYSLMGATAAIAGLISAVSRGPTASTVTGVLSSMNSLGNSFR